MRNKYFIIDFDSTFSKVEAMDLLCEIVHKDNPQKDEIARRIAYLTDAVMDDMDNYGANLQKRIELLGAHKNDVLELSGELEEYVSESFKRNKKFLLANKENIFIVSNGFVDFIRPVIEDFGLKGDQVFGNAFVYDDKDRVIGFDQNIPLANKGGKAEIIKQLNLDGDIYVIGDGYNDFEIHEAGLANRFFAFTENVHRNSVTDVADDIAPNLDDVLYELNMQRAHSYPKNRIKVTLLEGVHPAAKQIFEDEGYDVTYLHDAMTEDELCKAVKKANILGIRSKTQLTKKVIESATRLIAVGAYCIGTNQIDLETCTEHGVAVFNAPYSNTRSVVELAIANMIMLVRNLPDKITAMHNGKWEKSARNSYELRGKKLGIVGYGNIGAQLSVLGEALGLDVYFYDISDKLALGNATRLSSLNQLLSTCDIITLHVDGRTENDKLFGDNEFAQMKDGAIFLNLARGKVVDVKALHQAVVEGKVGGVAVDVFPHEPKSNDESFESELRGLPNTIITPHIGGSTQEAQEDIGKFVPGKIIDYINSGNTIGSVNLPEVKLPSFEGAHRLLHIHRNEPNVLAGINRILGEHNINILGQYLKTNEQVGYVITDIDTEYNQEVINELRSIEPTIWFRILY